MLVMTGPNTLEGKKKEKKKKNQNMILIVAFRYFLWKDF